jgi:hypothetical protein
MPNFTYVELEASAQSLSQGVVRTRGAVRTRGESASPDVIGFHILYFNDDVCSIPIEEFEYELEVIGDFLRVRIILPPGYLPPPPSHAYLVPKNAERQPLKIESVGDRHVLKCDRIARDRFYHLVLM